MIEGRLEVSRNERLKSAKNSNEVVPLVIDIVAHNIPALFEYTKLAMAIKMVVRPQKKHKQLQRRRCLPDFFWVKVTSPRKIKKTAARVTSPEKR